MPPHKMPPIIGSVNPVEQQPEPDAMETRFVLLAWDSKNRWWSLRSGFWSRFEACDKAGTDLPKRFTHYRVVTIPGDAE